MRGRKQDAFGISEHFCKRFARVNNYHKHINTLKVISVHNPHIRCSCSRDCLFHFSRCLGEVQPTKSTSAGQLLQCWRTHRGGSTCIVQLGWCHTTQKSIRATALNRHDANFRPGSVLTKMSNKHAPPSRPHSPGRG